MKITLKLRFNASKTKFENFGANKYLVYLVSDKKDQDVFEEVTALISRHLGVPTNKIQYFGKDANGDAVFEI